METTTEVERISSYPSIYNMGHTALESLFIGPVQVEEKIDGSQISFGRQGDKLLMRSKGKQLVVDAPEKMFQKAVDEVKAMFNDLRDGWTYRGEYLMSPKHNALPYSRVPAKNIILFDVDTGDQSYLMSADRKAEAERLGMEVVPVLHFGEIKTVEQIRSLAPQSSILGGAIPEGIVIKNYAQFGPDKKVLIGKYVRPEFKEENAIQWKQANPTQSDIVQGLILALKTEARWNKAVQHLRDAGKLQQAPQDIGPLMYEVEADIKKECEQKIKDKLFEWAWPKIARGTKAGLPEWYKSKLMEAALPSETANGEIKAV